jgi:hypothetical protein
MSTRQQTAGLGRSYLDKLFVVDLAVTVDIGFADHLVDLFLVEFLAQSSHHLLVLLSAG